MENDMLTRVQNVEVSDLESCSTYLAVKRDAKARTTEISSGFMLDFVLGLITHPEQINRIESARKSSPLVEETIRSLQKLVEDDVPKDQLLAMRDAFDANMHKRFVGKMSAN